MEPENVVFIPEALKSQVSSLKIPCYTSQKSTGKTSQFYLEQVPGSLNEASENTSKMALPREGKNPRKLEQFLPNMANDPCEGR